MDQTDYVSAFGVPDESPALNKAACERIAASISSHALAPVSKGLLEAAAYFYLLDRARRGSGRGVREDVRRLQARSSALADELRAARLYVLMFLGVMSALQQPTEPDGFKRLRRLGADALWLEKLSEGVLALHGPLPKFDVGSGLTIELLMTVYERATGRKSTHSANKDGEYRGVPQSSFGALALAFFKEVDPTLSATRIGNMIRNRLHRGQKKR